MATTSDIFLKYVFPSVGTITGLFMSFAPYRAVLQASRTGHLGDLNPTPWVFMLGNCGGWVAYSFLIHNLFVFLPNAPGFILAIWLNIQAIKIKYENHRSHELRENIIAALEEKSQKTLNRKEVTKIFDVAAQEEHAVNVIDPVTTTTPIDEVCVDESTEGSNHSPDDQEDLSDEEAAVGGSVFGGNMFQGHVWDKSALAVVWEVTAQKTPAPVSHELMVVGISTFWLLLATLVSLGSDFISYQARCLIIGLTVNVNLIFFYGAPLSKIMEVIRTKSSKLLHAPTMFGSTINGSLWCVYGWAVHDPFIMIPNGLGALLGVLQVVLYILYPGSKHSSRMSFSGVDILKLAQGEKLKASDESSDDSTVPLETTPLIW